MPISIDLNHAIFAKTAAGQQEIQARALGLSPMVRRILVLVDGQRSGKDLAAFATDADIAAILEELLGKGCVEALERVKAAASSSSSSRPAPLAEAAAEAAGSEADGSNEPGGKVADEFLLSLPDAAMRSSKDVEMARNFMINTVNTVFGQNMRLTLIQSIFEAKGSDGLRQAYLMWAESMSASRIGEKRLPELREKLARVL